MTVDFMIPGAMKCGTTTLAELLSKHPQICFSSKKEPEFFSKNEDWKKELNSYHKLFPCKERILGEASTGYTKFPEGNLEIWNDIYDYNSEMKFIYLVRNPFQRCVSQYMHMLRRGYLKSDFSTALRSNQSLINNGRYAFQIAPYIERFGAEQVMVIKFEELISNQFDVLVRISKFLNIDSNEFQSQTLFHENDSLQENKSAWKRSPLLRNISFLKTLVPKGMIPALKGMVQNTNRIESPELSYSDKVILKRFYEEDIKQLQNLTGEDFSTWRI